MNKNQGFKKLFSKENIIPTGVLLLIIAALLGLSIGIPLSQSVDNLKRAKEILSKHILVDG